MCDDEVAALVVDNGSGMCKVRTNSKLLPVLHPSLSAQCLMFSTFLFTRLDSPEMTLPELSSPPLSADPDTRE